MPGICWTSHSPVGLRIGYNIIAYTLCRLMVMIIASLRRLCMQLIHTILHARDNSLAVINGVWSYSSMVLSFSLSTFTFVFTPWSCSRFCSTLGRDTVRRGLGGGLGLSLFVSAGISGASSDPAECANIGWFSSCILKSGLFREVVLRLDRLFLCRCLRLSDVKDERDDDCLWANAVMEDNVVLDEADRPWALERLLSGNCFIRELSPVDVRSLSSGGGGIDDWRSWITCRSIELWREWRSFSPLNCLSITTDDPWLSLPWLHDRKTSSVPSKVPCSRWS